MAFATKAAYPMHIIGATSIALALTGMAVGVTPVVPAASAQSIRPSGSGPASSEAGDTTLFFTPAAACEHSGGQYLGDRNCRLANGKIIPIISSVEQLKENESSTVVASGTPRAWALATTAVLFESTGCRHDLLAGSIATPERIAAQKRSLKEVWHVGSRENLLDMLYWLQYSGHRKEFEALGHRVDTLSNRQFEALDVDPRLSGERRNQLEVVRRYHRRLGDTGILAWDLIRYVALCRWGYSVGYLSEDEAWTRIMPAALRLQQSFSSWEEMENNYLVGRRFWSLEQTSRDGSTFKAIQRKLLQDSASPWHINSWNMDLGVASPLPIIAIGVGQ